MVKNKWLSVVILHAQKLLENVQHCVRDLLYINAFPCEEKIPVEVQPRVNSSSFIVLKLISHVSSLNICMFGSTESLSGM